MIWNSTYEGSAYFLPENTMKAKSCYKFCTRLMEDLIFLAAVSFLSSNSWKSRFTGDWNCRISATKSWLWKYA
jgi:hypothetical protein